MGKTLKDYNDDDDFDENGILKDQRTLRSPMMLLDGMPPDVKQRVLAMDAADRKNAKRYGLGDDGGAMHRPGWRHHAPADPYAKDELIKARYDYIVDAENAWRGGKANAAVPRTSASGAGSRGPRETGRREGDRCLVQGQWGTLVDDGGGELICVPDDAGETRDAATIQRDHAETMRDEYARYEAELSEAWRGQK